MSPTPPTTQATHPTNGHATRTPTTRSFLLLVVFVFCGRYVDQQGGGVDTPPPRFRFLRTTLTPTRRSPFPRSRRIHTPFRVKRRRLQRPRANRRRRENERKQTSSFSILSNLAAAPATRERTLRSFVLCHFNLTRGAHLHVLALYHHAPRVPAKKNEKNEQSSVSPP